MPIGTPQNRAYSAAHFLLELDGSHIAGFFRSVDGGGVKSDILAYATSSNAMADWRQLAKPKYEDIKILVGMSMSQTFYQWISAFFAGEIVRKNGAILAGDFHYKERARSETSSRPTPPPPFGFLKGAVLGLVVLLPLAALACYLLAQIGIGDRDATYTQVIAFVAVFGGLPGIVSAGGVGRVAARTAVAPRRGGTGWSILVSAAACTIIGAGVVILSVVPLGEVPTTSEHWLWITGFGGGAGLVCGIMIGLWVSYSPQRT